MAFNQVKYSFVEACLRLPKTTEVICTYLSCKPKPELASHLSDGVDFLLFVITVVWYLIPIVEGVNWVLLIVTIARNN